MRRLCLIPVILLVGCTSRPGATPDTASALKQTAEAWSRSFASRDPGQITSFLAEDGVAWYPGHEVPIVGRAANRAPWQAYFDARPTHPVSVESVTVAASGDLGYTTGKFLYSDPSDPGAEGGRYVAVWKPVAGAWKIVLLSAHAHSDVTGADFPTP